MGTVKRSYGPWSQAMLGRLRELDELKLEAFVAYLAENGIDVDRTLVSHWCAGRTHLPADVLPWLAAFTGDPARVFGRFVREVSCDVVESERGGPEDKDLIHLLLEAGSSLGRLQSALLDARSPESPGGEAITSGEANGLRDQLNDLIHHLADLRFRLRQRCQGVSPGGLKPPSPSKST